MTEEEGIQRKSTPHKNRNILVVEDNEVNRLIASMVLENMGHTISFAHNGKECIKLLSTHSYDCIFMDIQMPEMNGLETTAFIRKVLKKPIPIIGLSASGYPEDIEKSLQAGMNDHIEKIYTQESIARVLDKWIS